MPSRIFGSDIRTQIRAQATARTKAAEERQRILAAQRRQEEEYQRQLAAQRADEERQREAQVAAEARARAEWKASLSPQELKLAKITQERRARAGANISLEQAYREYAGEMSARRQLAVEKMLTVGGKPPSQERVQAAEERLLAGGEISEFRPYPTKTQFVIDTARLGGSPLGRTVAAQRIAVQKEAAALAAMAPTESAVLAAPAPAGKVFLGYDTVSGEPVYGKREAAEGGKPVYKIKAKFEPGPRTFTEEGAGPQTVAGVSIWAGEELARRRAKAAEPKITVRPPSPTRTGFPTLESNLLKFKAEQEVRMPVLNAANTPEWILKATEEAPLSFGLSFITEGAKEAARQTIPEGRTTITGLQIPSNQTQDAQIMRNIANQNEIKTGKFGLVLKQGDLYKFPKEKKTWTKAEKVELVGVVAETAVTLAPIGIAEAVISKGKNIAVRAASKINLFAEPPKGEIIFGTGKTKTTLEAKSWLGGKRRAYVSETEKFELGPTPKKTPLEFTEAALKKRLKIAPAAYEDELARPVTTRATGYGAKVEKAVGGPKVTKYKYGRTAVVRPDEGVYMMLNAGDKELTLAAERLTSVSARGATGKKLMAGVGETVQLSKTISTPQGFFGKIRGRTKSFSLTSKGVSVKGDTFSKTYIQALAKKEKEAAEWMTKYAGKQRGLGDGEIRYGKFIGPPAAGDVGVIRPSGKTLTQLFKKEGATAKKAAKADAEYLTRIRNQNEQLYRKAQGQIQMQQPKAVQGFTARQAQQLRAYSAGQTTRAERMAKAFAKKEAARVGKIATQFRRKAAAGSIAAVMGRQRIGTDIFSRAYGKPVSRTRLTPLTRYKSSQAQVAQAKTGTASIWSTAAKQEQRNLQRMRQGQREADITITRLATSPMEATTPITRYATATGQGTVQLTRYGTMEIPAPVPPPRVPVPFWFGGMGRGKQIPAQASKDTQGYNLFIKEKGKFFKATRKPLSRNEALMLGSRAVDNSAAATFKIKRAKKQVNPVGFMLAPSLNKFYASKKGGYTEKTGYRIDTPGEVRGISARGWLRQQQMRNLGIPLRKSARRKKYKGGWLF